MKSVSKSSCRPWSKFEKDSEKDKELMWIHTYDIFLASYFEITLISNKDDVSNHWWLRYYINL